MKHYSFEEISEILDYRPPMALLDAAVEEGEKKWKAVKNITFDDLVFNGHFPGHPIMPGVMQLEAMEQLAELSLHRIMRGDSDRLLLAKKLSKVKFRKPALPGDRLVLELEVKNVSAEEADCSVQIRTASGLISQAEITMGFFPRRRGCVSDFIYAFDSWDRGAELAADLKKIVSVIPHRYPFLFLDYILKIDQSKVLAVKNISSSEPFLKGHSAKTPTLPVPFMSEIIAQAGCVLTLSKPSNTGKIAYFMAIDEAECFEPARPGDQLRLDVDVPEGSSKFGRGEGRILVGDKMISRTIMTFALVDAK